MTWIAHLIERVGDRWEPAGGKAFEDDAAGIAKDKARSYAEQWESEDPDNRRTHVAEVR